MKTVLGVTVLVIATMASIETATAQTCADQHQACLGRGHSQSDCQKSTTRCLATGRWIGPAGKEYPITKKK